MSYALAFVHKDAGQSWEEAFEAVRHARDVNKAREPDRDAWEHITTGVGRLLGEPSLRDGPGFLGWEDEATGIELSLETDHASITVPYWYRDEDARRIVSTLYALGAVIEDATGLSGYDVQVELPLADAAARPELAVAIFNQTADSFRGRRIWTPANG